jgi:hypothetical protein
LPDTSEEDKYRCNAFHAFLTLDISCCSAVA